AELHDGNTQLVIHWAGLNSSNIAVLTKNQRSGSVRTSNVYFSYDYGATFSRKISSSSSGSLPQARISDFVHAYHNIDRYIFMDRHTPSLFTTTDSGRNFHHVTPLPFTPSTLTINPVKPWIVIGHDETGKNLFKSSDFGSSWIRIQTRVEKYEFGFSAATSQFETNPDTLYVRRTNLDGSYTILRSETYFQNDIREQVVISHVTDFLLMNATMVAVRNSPQGSGNKELWLARTRHSRFSKASFPNTLTMREFYVVDASDGQIMVCVNHGPGVSNIYISEPNGVDFSLSLQNVTYYTPLGPESTFSLYANKRFADIHKVSGMKSIFIANVMTKSSMPGSMRSLITFDKGGFWEHIPAPEYDATGAKINCSVRSGCSLHLTQAFHQAYPSTRSNPIFSVPSAPGFVLGQGNIGKSIRTDPSLFFSDSAGRHWTNILSGLWFYVWGDHGGIIAAVMQFQRSNLLWYSTNQGQTWDTHQFYNETIRVYGLMTEPGETSTVFTVFGSTNTGVHSWVIVQVDLRAVLPAKCKDEDYKDWSPVDERGVTCIMGGQTKYKRRRQHANCYNGRNYDRPTTIKQCQCTRLDFECDAGFHVPNFWGIYCVPNPTSTMDPYQVPPTCSAGKFYNRTKGYRKLEGDICQGGSAESHYAPDLVPCPVQEENSFMILSTSIGLQRYDMVTNQSVLLNNAVPGIHLFDFDYKTNCLYWVYHGRIKVTCFNVTTSVQINSTTLFNPGSRIIRSLSVDWLSRNIYWCDGNVNVINMEGKFVRMLENPQCLYRQTYMTIDPTHGYIYTACSSNTTHVAIIYRMNMDGTNVTALIHTLHRSDVHNMKLDLPSDNLYWFQSSRVFHAFLDGTRIRTLARLPDHTTTIDVFKSKLYWMNTGDMIYFRDKYSVDTDHLMIGSNYFQVSMYLIFTRQSQSAHPSPCLTQKCTQLCTAVPTTTGHMTGKCMCSSSGEVLVSYRPDGSEVCTCPPHQLYTNSSCVATNKTCQSNEMLCSNERCVLQSWVCDGQDDCGDGSDENDCRTNHCQVYYQFQCDNMRCIPTSWQCDHDDDCRDSSDEQGCQYATCDNSTSFLCDNGHCKNKAWTCDGDNDCGDWSDERNCCVLLVTCMVCLLSSWSGHCFPRLWVCDGDIDCVGGSDEANCTHHTNTTCANTHQHPCNNGRCIYTWWFCDGTADCADRSDELNCPTTPVGLPIYILMGGKFSDLSVVAASSLSVSSNVFLHTATTPTTPIPTLPPHECGSTHLPCRTSGMCYPLVWRCDGVDDCGDDSDEFDCNTTSSTPTAHHLPCFSDLLQFRCANQLCIFRFYKCDGDNDCGDWSDERGCPNGNMSSVPSVAPPTANPMHCVDGYTYCGVGGTRTCILDRFVCDGDNDCGNNADEKNCGQQCGTDQFTCHNGRCIALSLHCNGIDDCSDNSDENCTTVDCGPSFYRCAADNHCILRSSVCNGYPDCSDNADEQGCAE
uniref:VPS10 domain-containing protein n=1 Tax=Ciona intestinalis TaxID=7719 RepID=F6V4V0_CIOIN